jgi:integrase
MIGSRPLTSEEVASVLKTFSGAYAARDRALFILGLKSGFRISEMLSLRVSNVWKDGKVAEVVSVARKRMKGEGRREEGAGEPGGSQGHSRLARSARYASPRCPSV